MANVQEIIKAKQKAMIPNRLLKGAEVLGELWRSGVRCVSQWSGVCPCPAPTDFCEAKKRWLGLVLEFYDGKYPYELSGTENLLVLECMDGRMFDATGITILLALPGARAPIRVGRKGTCGQTIIDLRAIPDGPDQQAAIEAVIRIQAVL